MSRVTKKGQTTLNKIEMEVLKLSVQDQLRLMEKMIHHLKNTTTKKELDWSGLYGIGKGLWKEDAQEYVNRLREDRI